MKKRSNVLVLACIPAVFILILLGTGLPQRFLSAVSVGQRDYTIAQYNFYYYETYASFVTAHYDELDELGLNINQELKKQRCDESMTWAEYFRVEALSAMREYAVLYDAALAEGFDAGDRVRQVKEEKAEELREYCVANNIKKVETYLTGLYDAGMTEDIFYRELERRTTAEAYREYLLEQIRTETAAQPGTASVSDGDYRTADAVVSLFRPGADRVSGQAEERQWDNAETLAQAALARAEAWGGDLPAFCAAAEAYSELGDASVPDGHYPALTHEDLDGPLEDWCFDAARKPGDTTVVRGASGWYLAYFNGWGESASALREHRERIDRAYDEWLSGRMADYPLKTHWLGMQIAR